MPRNPAWFILIEQWRPRDMGEMGPTLPFIVGALALKANRPADTSHLDAVLDDIVAHPVPRFVTETSWCPNIQAPVFTLGELDGYRMRSSVVFPRRDRSGDALVFGQNLVFRWSLKEATDALQRLAADAAGPVGAQQFSRNWDAGSRQYAYGPFLPGELEYINTVLS